MPQQALQLGEIPIRHGLPDPCAGDRRAIKKLRRSAPDLEAQLAPSAVKVFKGTQSPVAEGAVKTHQQATDPQSIDQDRADELLRRQGPDSLIEIKTHM